jgi:hypothetical protein
MLNAQPGVKYDLVSSYLTKIRWPGGAAAPLVEIREALALTLDVGILRPLVGDF